MYEDRDIIFELLGGRPEDLGWVGRKLFMKTLRKVPRIFKSHQFTNFVDTV